MSAANKAKGTLFESQVCDYLQSVGIDAKRLPRTGVKDIGDASFPLNIPLIGNQHVVIEIKNRQSLDWPTFLEEAETEAGHYLEKYPAVNETFPLVIAKRRMKGVHRSYVVQELDSYIEFLKATGTV